MHKLLLTATLVCLSLGTILAQRFQQPTTVKVFDQTPICFNPQLYPDGIAAQPNNTLYLGNGRIALKKIHIPPFRNYTEVDIEIALVSKGDPWDKSGSCFVIPASSNISMLNVANNSAAYPPTDSTRYEALKGIVAGTDYLPTVELMRFMTPFGVGHFSDNTDSVSAKRRPIYVDGWADKVVWTQRITDLLPLLEGDFYVGVYIDTWTKEGYAVDVKLTYRESNLRADRKPKTKVLPLINTNYYMGQSLPDIFSRKDVEVDFTIPKRAKNVRLKYIATGHGGHSGGDEFRPQRNIVYINNTEVLNFLPWRTDCASFRRFNPTSGTWLAKRTTAYITDEGKRGEKEIEESLASSDLSRSNWCPGSDVVPEEVNLPTLGAGNHTLRISIPESAPMSDNKLNHWLVSAYLVWEE